ncbi:MAG: FkbM family methyltransferase [Pseudomonadota bacterium]
MPQGLARWIKQRAGVPDMGGRLHNLKAAGFACTGAVDAGAFRGEWSRLAAATFGCPILAIEPQDSPELEQLAAQIDLRVAPVALGERVGEATFMLEGSNSRIPSAEDEAYATHTMTVPVEDLLTALRRHPELSPNLLKLDLQGGELPTLLGAGAALNQFEVVIVEVSVIAIGGVPDFDEVHRFLTQAGYRLYDFLPTYYRPLDQALWQADAFYVRNDSALVASTRWQ